MESLRVLSQKSPIGPKPARPPEDEPRPTELYRVLSEIRRAKGATTTQREEVWRLAKLSPKAAVEMLHYDDYLPERPEVYDWFALQVGESRLPVWVLVRDPRRRSQLVAKAKEGSEEALHGLARLDWKSAEPIARSLTTSKSSYTALQLLFAKYPGDPKVRAELLALVNSPTAGQIIKDIAARILLGEKSTEADALFELLWPRPEWNSDLGTGPLVDFIARDPQRWTPYLTRELCDPSSARHRNAAHLLVDLGTADSLRPLLPWLKHPDTDWTRIYVEALARVDLPEAIPSLVAIVENDKENRLVAAAVSALQRYDVPELREILRRRILSSDDDWTAKWVAAQGIRLNFFTPSEKLAAIGELADGLAVADEKSQANLLWSMPEGPLSPQYILAIALMDEPDAALRSDMLALARQWRATQDSRLPGLEKLILQLKDVTLSYAVEQLGQGDISPALLRRLFEKALFSPEELQPLRADLDAMRALGGPRGAVAMCLLGDQVEIDRALRTGTPETVTALLSAARIMGLELSLATLEETAKDHQFKDLVVACLEPRSDRAAHQLLLRLSKAYAISGQAYGGENAGFLSEQQGLLLTAYEELGRRGEVYSLTGFTGGYTAFPFQYEVWMMPEKAEFRISFGTAGYEVRELDAAERRSFEEFINGRGVDEWPRSEWTGRTHTPDYEYLHLKPSGGHRVTANIENLGPPSNFRAGRRYGELYHLFRSLADKPTASVHSALEGIPHARTVYDSHYVWQVSDFTYPPEPSAEAASFLYEHTDGSVLARVEQGDTNVRWRRVEADGLGGPVEAPSFAKGSSTDIRKSRPAQPSGAGQYWSAKESDSGTVIGVVDEQGSRFERRGYYPNLSFSTPEMWVVGEKVYVVVRGDILGLPLGDFADGKTNSAVGP